MRVNDDYSERPGGAFAKAIMKPYERRNRGALAGEECPYCGEKMRKGAVKCSSCLARRRVRPRGIWGFLTVISALGLMFGLFLGLGGILNANQTAILLATCFVLTMIVFPRLAPVTPVYEEYQGKKR